MRVVALGGRRPAGSDAKKYILGGGVAQGLSSGGQCMYPLLRVCQKRGTHPSTLFMAMRRPLLGAAQCSLLRHDSGPGPHMCQWAAVGRHGLGLGDVTREQYPDPFASGAARDRNFGECGIKMEQWLEHIANLYWRPPSAAHGPTSLSRVGRIPLPTCGTTCLSQLKPRVAGQLQTSPHRCGCGRLPNSCWECPLWG